MHRRQWKGAMMIVGGCAVWSVRLWPLPVPVFLSDDSQTRRQHPSKHRTLIDCRTERYVQLFDLLSAAFVHFISFHFLETIVQHMARHAHRPHSLSLLSVALPADGWCAWMNANWQAYFVSVLCSLFTHSITIRLNLRRAFALSLSR